jgi:hypothetical protein
LIIAATLLCPEAFGHGSLEDVLSLDAALERQTIRRVLRFAVQ